jgi:hypothetical protein
MNDDMIKMFHELGFKVIVMDTDSGGMPVVICDLCNKDWTGSETSGGGVFSSTGVCPDCEPNFLEGFNKYVDERKYWVPCPPHISHYEFIVRFRRGEYTK